MSYAGMVDFTTTSELDFDLDCSQVDIAKVLIIVSTKCFYILPNHPENPLIHFSCKSIIPVCNCCLIVIQISISYEYRHDLNVFTKQAVDNIISALYVPSEIVSVLVEE
jgi:hypothetical protein